MRYGVELFKLKATVEALWRSEDACGVTMPAIPPASKAELTAITCANDASRRRMRLVDNLLSDTSDDRSPSDNVMSATSFAIADAGG